MKNWWHSLPDVHTQHVHLVVVVVPRSFSFSAASSSYPIHYLCDNIDMILFCQIFFLSGFVVVVVIRLWYLWKIEDDTELSLNLVKVTYGEREYGPVGGFFFYFRIHRREMTFFFFFAVCFLQSSCLSALWRMGMNIKHDEHKEKKPFIRCIYISVALFLCCMMCSHYSISRWVWCRFNCWRRHLNQSIENARASRHTYPYTQRQQRK